MLTGIKYTIETVRSKEWYVITMSFDCRPDFRISADNVETLFETFNFFMVPPEARHNFDNYQDYLRVCESSTEDTAIIKIDKAA